MKFKEQLSLLKRIDFLIRRKATGKPQDFAKKLNISEASLFRYLRDLKDMGAPIFYNSDRENYTYLDDFTLNF